MYTCFLGCMVVHVVSSLLVDRNTDMEESLCCGTERSRGEGSQGVLQGSQGAVEYRMFPLGVV